MVTELFNSGQLTEGELEDYYVTFMASVFRSVRFGASSAHGKANMLRFNFFKERNAFTRLDNGQYRINIPELKVAATELTNKILKLQGDGDYEGARKFMDEMGFVGPVLKEDLQRVERAGIPTDIVFEQGIEVLGLEPTGPGNETGDLEAVRRGLDRAIEADVKNHGPLDGHPVKVYRILKQTELPDGTLAHCYRIANESQRDWRIWFEENQATFNAYQQRIQKLKAGGDRSALKKVQADKKRFMHTAPSLLRDPKALKEAMTQEQYESFLLQLEQLKKELHNPGSSVSN